MGLGSGSRGQKCSGFFIPQGTENVKWDMVVLRWSGLGAGLCAGLEAGLCAGLEASLAVGDVRVGPAGSGAE